jgi:hypothetical protein
MTRGSKSPPSKSAVVAKSGKLPSPVGYVLQKKPGPGGTETLLVLAKYLPEFRNKSDFTQREIQTIRREATIPPRILGRHYTFALSVGFLRKLRRGVYALSIIGEERVAEMPFGTPSSMRTAMRKVLARFKNA